MTMKSNSYFGNMTFVAFGFGKFTVDSKRCWALNKMKNVFITETKLRLCPVLTQQWLMFAHVFNFKYIAIQGVR